MHDAWSREEVEATVADYVAMLAHELRGEAYNKSAHRRALMNLLNGRSETAIERKHMNISAVLREMEHPWIDGYKPYGNYQTLLIEIVEAHLSADIAVQNLVEQLAIEPAEIPAVTDLLSTWSDPPEMEQINQIAEPVAMQRNGRKTDYLKREAHNRSLGLAGERFVLQFEAERLHRAGHTTLANRIEHISQSQGDGLGYDVLSFDESGRERLIEVKTTSYGKRTPFYVTTNELECSHDEHDRYHLYRVYNFRQHPGLFGLQGRLDDLFILEPSQFIARR